MRFSLEIPAFSRNKEGEEAEVLVRQISVGGCLAQCDDSIFIGDDVRLEFTLANKNRLPIFCKAIYRFPGKGIGLKFHEITQFEQELLGTVICTNLENEGLPLLVNPFTHPPTDIDKELSPPRQASEVQLKEEQFFDDLIATEG